MKKGWLWGLAGLMCVGGLGGTMATLLLRTTTNDAPVVLYVQQGELSEELGRPPAAIARRYPPHDGRYEVQPHEPRLRLWQRLHRGQQDPMQLTINNIRTPEQLSALLTEQLRDTFSVPIDSFYLFRPNTYEVYWTTSAERLYRRMRREFETERRQWGDCKLTDEEVIILASIVEEETRNAAEKPLIASVYLNRLRVGMPLQADPTVKYAVGDFALRRILNVHLATESPYNTYLHTGLPPHPICLPSATSVAAVVHPATTGYFYFCASDAMDGTHRFATTLSEHNRNAAAFHSALNRRGIKQ